ncbi:MAG: gamma-glutamylcyclotransferase [Rhodospirillales bacterium]|nr:MAG: gamma-glutamylcyclotransferase [Rhodospirillales bacterium]
MDRDVLACVLGRRPPDRPRPARLNGYRRMVRAGASYPILVADPAAAVAGILVSGLDAHDQDRLRRFEGEDYRLDRLAVLVRCGGTMTAQVFMPQPWVQAGSEPWDLPAWRRRHKARYVARLRAFGMCDPD